VFEQQQVSRDAASEPVSAVCLTGKKSRGKRVLILTICRYRNGDVQPLATKRPIDFVQERSLVKRHGREGVSIIFPDCVENLLF